MQIESERDRATRRVMLTVPRLLAGAPLPVKAEDGSYPVVVMLPSDSVEEFESRRLELGGNVNLFVAYPERLVLVTAHEGALREDVDNVHPASAIDMLVELLKVVPGNASSIAVNSPTPAIEVRELEYAF